MSSSISSTSSASQSAQAQSGASTVLNQSQTLGQDAFLQLLVAQLQNQDPLQPQDNTQMVAQLAQFSALEQMTDVANTDSQILSAVQSLQSVTSVAFEHQLIGTNISVDDGSGNTVTGQVSSIKISNGEPQVVVNGTSYPLSQVVQMS
ncbi:flagellar hook capping FlgD N-terminal domain-containing protein [Alicyclobacillus fastidiosus]|uniref:Flagellar hook capping FlgD N-terminal domain-containing protein n=1 Tax=Alicyclobacillus fastidiosus TaxID=392011 RepID=A0ABV5AH13_9BACL|nr:flagellar hook capping FlgD N-terminal domain-containing protein [Alicyclobacillus fastidiosus]WEH07923.1 flagellar hook capping FlgD N-terminal domain-containing protein [Alicyclobacillus fastidiosus]